MSGAASATMWYDGDGLRVKAVINGVTSVYIGNYYEVSGGVVKKYYYLGGVRVAMSDGGTVRYLLTDHLGSTAKTVNSDASVYGELRYMPWGGNRYSSGSDATSYRFTGQREDSGIGLASPRHMFPPIRADSGPARIG